jgi:hypothetical protein
MQHCPTLCTVQPNAALLCCATQWDTELLSFGPFPPVSNRAQSGGNADKHQFYHRHITGNTIHKSLAHCWPFFVNYNPICGLYWISWVISSHKHHGALGEHVFARRWDYCQNITLTQHTRPRIAMTGLLAVPCSAVQCRAVHYSPPEIKIGWPAGWLGRQGHIIQYSPVAVEL